MDPFNIKASLKALAASKRQEPSSYQSPPQEEPRDPIQKLGGRIQKDIVKEAPPGLLERAGGTALSGLATVGNLLDVPGSMVRDVATWLPGGPKPANPLDQLVSPFTHHNRTTGRDLIRGYGLAGKEDTMGNFTTGLGAEIALDPLTYLTFGASALTRGGRAAKALNMMDDAPEIASRLMNRRVGKREARHVVTPRMLLSNPKIGAEARQRLQQRMTEMGVTEKDLDRQLGGLAKINMPFSSKPFKFGDKPFTFWGLTDEEGIIGAGKTRGRGPDPIPPVREVPVDTPPGDIGPSGGGAGGGDGPDIPPTRGPAPDITDMPDSPITPAAPEVPPLAGPAAGAPVVEPPPVAPSATINAISDIQQIDPNNFGVQASIPESKSRARATLTYASESDETPMLFIDQFEKQPGSPKGSGRALINSMVEKVKDRNPMGVAGNFDTHDQLGAFASIFGKDKIRFLDRATGQPVDISFAEVNKTPDTISKYTAVHYFIEPPKAAAKVEPEVPQYKPEEIEAGWQLGYKIEDIPRNYNEMAADIKSNPVRLLAAESAANNLVDMVSTEGTPLLEALDDLESHVDFRFDGLGLGKPSPAEIEHARGMLYIIDRPLNINDLIEHGKARVADAGKGKAQAEAERIFKKYGSFDMDEGAYYRAVLGEVPKPKKQKRLISDATVEPMLPAHEVLMRTDPALYQKWKNGEVEELSRYTNNPEHDGIYFRWTDAGLEHPWPSLVKGDEKVWEQFRHVPQNIAPDKSWDSVANRSQQPANAPPSALQPDLMTPEVVKEAKKRGRKPKNVPEGQKVTEAEDKAKSAQFIAEQNQQRMLEQKKQEQQGRINNWKRAYQSQPKEYLAASDLGRKDYEKALTAISPMRLMEMVDDGVVRGAFTAQEAADLKLPIASAARADVLKKFVDSIDPSKTPAQAERIAIESYSSLTDEEKGLFGGSRDFGVQVSRYAGEARRNRVPASATQPDLVTPQVVQEAKKSGRKPKPVAKAEAPVSTPAPTKPMTSMEAMQAEAGIKPATQPSVIARKTQALLQEIAELRGAADAEVAEMLLRGDTASAIRRLEAKPLDGLKIRGLLLAAERNDILTAAQSDAILDAIPPKFKGGVSVLDEAKQVSNDLASKSKLESRIDQTETPEFKNWFKASKAVDEAGKPLELYHGSLADFKEFRPADTSSYYGRGVYLTASPEDASKYASSDVSVNLDYGPKAEKLAGELGISYKEAKEVMEGTGGNVYKVYASLQNPLILETKPIRFDESAMRLALAEGDVAVKDVTKLVKELNAAKTAKLQHDILARNRATQSLASYASLKNHDGLIVGGEMAPRSGGSKHVIAFRSEQVKSAIGNRGTWSGKNILESRIDQTETPEFKNWFGDWKKDPANASKVVDADGKPLVVYHGTRHSDLGVAARKERNRRTLELVSAEKEWLANSMPLRDELRKQRDVAREELNEAAKRLAEPLAPDKHSIGDIAHGLAYNSSRHDTLRDISEAWYPFARNQRSYTGPSGAILKKADDAFAAIEPFRQKLNDIENEISKIPRRPEHTLGELVEEEPFFDTLRYGENDEGYLSAGSYFTADTRVASNYAGPYEGSGVLPVYLNLKNPYIHGVTVDNQVDKLANQIYEKKAQTLRNARADVDDYSRARAESQREALIQLGYDGEIRDSKLAGKSRAFEDTEYVAFYPEQIKSATGNRGTFDPNSKNILEAQGGKASGAKMAPTKVDLDTLEGLPEQARPIVGDMINKIGQKLFDDVTMEVGGDAAKAVTTGDIDMDTGFIRIYNSAIESGIVDKTTVHELWHHLSKFITAEEVRIVQKEFDDAVKANKGPLPYELSSIDEYFAHKLTDLSMKYLGKEKPASLIGKAWAKALDVFEYLWDAIRQTLGYDKTKQILNSFLGGHRAGAVKLTDATMQQRLVGDVEINGNILDSQASPIIPNSDIAGQLAQAKSAILGKSLDDIGESILDSAVGRQLTAMFDQSVLGQITKAGIEAARLAFKGYRDAVFQERAYMVRHLRTWYDLPNIREDIIMDEELAPLAEYITNAGGDRALGAKNRMIEARKIQNDRVNGLRRLLEQPLWDEQGNWIQDAYRVEESELPAWVGQEKANGQIINNPTRRQQVAEMLTAWRLKAVQMLGGERNEGILLSLVNGYFPRLVSNLPGSNRSLWNPNYGKILDPTHPSAKRRKDWFVGYDDGTSVINDISIDAELSGAHSKKMVREQPSPAEIQQYANILWERYKDRLMGGRAQLTYGELAQADPKAFAKINKLTEEVMNLDPRHVEHQIPLFSNDLFSAMELRLEHHHRSVMHAKAIQHLVKKNAVARNLIGGDGQGVTLNQLLKESKYDSNVSRDILEVGTRGDTALAADKSFWNQEIQPRINEVMRHYQAERAYYLRNPGAELGTPTGVAPYTDPGGRAFQVLPYEGDGIRRFVFPQFFDKKVPGVPSHQMKLEVNLDDPSETVVTWFDQLDDGENFIGESLAKILDNPTNKTSSAGYVSGTPTYVLFEHITIPKDIGDAITKFVQGPRTLEEVRPLVRGYDKGTNMWKMMQTGMLPFIGFHGRNFGSGQASNFYLGVQNDPRFKFNLADPTTYLNPIRSFVQPIIDAHKTATGQTVKDAASMPQFAGMNLTDEAATEALRREMYAQGITGEKQGLSAEQLTDTVGTAASQFPGIDKAKSINPFAWQWSKPVPESTFAQRWLMPWMSKGVMSDADVFRPGQLGRDLGSYTEALNRLAPYIAMRRQGFDPKAAAREVNRAQVDYTNLSNFNREYTRRLFPFASYTLGMTPTVFGELASRPGGGMGRTVMATTAAGQSSEQGVTPDYIRETASIPLGMSEDGTRSYITGFGLPFEDPLQFAQLARGNVSGVLRELGSRMNPVPKSLIEIMTGRSLYQAGPFGGREIEDLDPTIGRIVANINDLATGEKTEKAEPFLGNPWAEYIIANAGPGRMLNTVRTITDPRKWDTVPWKLALNLGTGVRVADVSPSAQDAILRERLARVMKDFGGRMYSRPYFPDYAKEDWTPQEAEDAAKIDALLKLLGQRAKERRV